MLPNGTLHEYFERKADGRRRRRRRYGWGGGRSLGLGKGHHSFPVGARWRLGRLRSRGWGIFIYMVTVWNGSAVWFVDRSCACDRERLPVWGVGYGERVAA